ncbi:aspartyl protease family protein [Arsenicibacter rosenii]|uniref:Signal protein PDZ n=1 Tax=Arsenicibacter rosenii TaxID=1750698 RepID=A0A1S2VEE8_9BACT|nr:aspartyl protease family protein [Arsenicibacter rosenii]OIN57082.1 signal protein PDZ [Arsenicibacter rosenii]
MKTLGWILALMGIWLTAAGKDKEKPDKDRFGFHLSGNRQWTRIPFQLHSNLIIIPVQINGSDTLRFILDTGVSSTIITDPSVLKRQKLALTRKVNLAGAGEGGTLTASVAIDNQMNIGHVRASHHNVVVLDEDILKLSEYVGTPIHGIFGFELFNNFVVSIDFLHREILLMNPKKYRYRKSKGDKYPIVIQDAKPYTDVVAVFDGKAEMPMRVVLDTGAGHALLLDRTRSGNQAGVALPEKVVRAQLGRGLSGVINGSLGRIQKIRFGRYEMDDILASFPDSMSFGMKINSRERQGNVGCELLRRFYVTFNYQDQYVVLKPVKRLLRESFEHDMSGMELRAKGEQYRTYYVDRVIEGSPADSAGLAEGDELMFINSQAAADLTISDIYKMLQKGEGKEIVLMVRRRGQLVITQFALKRLI